MSFKIFYSWQSDTDEELNWRFIGICIREAVKRLKNKYKYSYPDFIYDRDTKDVPGWPNIPATVYDKVEKCDVFIADLSVIGTIPGKKPKPQLNSNVVGELNFALAKIGEQRIINVMNTYYGRPEEDDVIPFDFVQRRFPIQYSLSQDNINDIENVKEKLTSTLYEAIKAIFDSEHERYKKEMEPFETWKSWDNSIKKEFRFEINEYIETQFKTIREQTLNSKTATRILGLSGLGKTRLLLECFRSENGINSEIISRLLYANMYDCNEAEVFQKCKELFRNKEAKTVILDNCSIQLHSKVQNLFTNEGSKLNLITISTEPDENYQEIDSEGKTQIIKLVASKFKDVVKTLLQKNFPELQEQEVDLIVDYSNGLPFFAKLMVENPQRGRYHPGSLNANGVVERLLGELYLNNDTKAIVTACCLFSKFGFFEDLEIQSKFIALSSELCNITLTEVHPDDIADLKLRKFKVVCSTLHERQLLERRGRTFSFRPSPLAIRMAEEWWQNCTYAKFQRLLPVLQESGLIEDFCEQFKYLKHIEHAKDVIQDLCEGVFSLAEVLNTKVGSRLFRSFVYVNPIACTNAVSKAFLSLPTEKLQKIIEGRRNLVWALEKLCFRNETFETATKVLASFSIAENEEIANNSTNQFLQLFHIYLPGTAVNLNSRWDIIEYCFVRNEAYVNLGLKALSRCIKSDQFHRMNGAEDQGDVIPLQDYNPNRNEIQDYRRKAIEKLSFFVSNVSTYSQIATEILFDNLYSLCVHDAKELIPSIVETITNSGLIDKMEIRKKIQFILNAKRVFDTNTVDYLQRVYDNLAPTSFTEKFLLYVQNPSSDEYFSDEEQGNDREGDLLKKINSLALEFISQQSKWRELAILLTAGNIYEGLRFGKEISNNLDNDEERFKLLQLLSEQVKKIDLHKRNPIVLIGLLTQVKDKNYQIKFVKSILESHELKYLTFNIARNINLPFEIIRTFLTLTEQGVFSTSEFLNFEYGWGIDHLQHFEIVELLNRVRQIDAEGKAVAFRIIIKWSYNKPDLWDLYKSQIRGQLIDDGLEVFKQSNNSMDYHNWSDTTVKLLKSSNDTELAIKSIDLILEESNKTEGYYSKNNSFYIVCDVLQELYFEILWSKIISIYNNIDQFRLAAFHFRDLLGSKQDAYSNTEGILFKGNKSKFEQILDYCRVHQNDVIHWISQLLPVYDTTSKDTWHPYALTFIDEFGHLSYVLSGISSKIGTYSWKGSIVPKLETDKKLFEHLLNHQTENVRKWAQSHILDLDKRIHWENNRDEEYF